MAAGVSSGRQRGSPARTLEVRVGGAGRLPLFTYQIYGFFRLLVAVSPPPGCRGSGEKQGARRPGSSAGTIAAGPVRGRGAAPGRGARPGRQGPAAYPVRPGPPVPAAAAGHRGRLCAAGKPSFPPRAAVCVTRTCCTTYANIRLFAGSVGPRARAFSPRSAARWYRGGCSAGSCPASCVWSGSSPRHRPPHSAWQW